MRTAKIDRKTKETDITISLNIDGTGKSSIKTGIGFFDHMLELMGKHGFFDLTVRCKGDIHVDEHHTVEDVGIVLGEAFDKAFGDRKGINRYGFSRLPMDESLAEIAVDISGRSFLHYDIKCRKVKTGNFELAVLKEFFQAFVNAAKITMHISSPYGNNAHHVYEAVFKGIARALDMASSLDSRQKGVPSTKGIL